MKIFFDVDGVLIDGFHAKPERQNRWDKTIKADLGIDPEKLQKIFKGWFLNVLEGRLNFEEEMDRWLKQQDYDVKAWQVIDYWHRKDSNYNHQVWNVVQKLSKSESVQLYTATNQTHERINFLRDVLGWSNHFDDFYYSARLGCIKHNPDYFAKIEYDLNFNPRRDDHLYFDDDIRNIEVSSSRGWNAVLVDGPEDVSSHPKIIELMENS